MVVRKECKMYRYIHGNEIYLVFGVVVFAVVRFVGESLGIHLYTIIIEIMGGIVIYGLLCILYCKKSHQDFYLQMGKDMIKKIFNVVERK